MDAPTVKYNSIKKSNQNRSVPLLNFFITLCVVINMFSLQRNFEIFLYIRLQNRTKNFQSFLLHINSTFMWVHVK